MKKVLAWVLALALVLSSFAMSFAAYTDADAVADANAQTAVRVLTALGVITGYPDGSFKPAKDVTRAEMAALVIRAMGMDDNMGNYETKYSDVAKSNWCSGVVYYATKLGIIEGYPDGTFKPNNPVTYFEAITMILRSLGYRDEYLIGSWPANFVNQAEELGTYKKYETVSTENFAKNANRADCAIMIFNTLNVPMVTYDKQNRGVLTQKDNYLKRLADMTISNGTVEMDDIMSTTPDVLGYEDLGAPYAVGFIVDGDLVDVILDDDYTYIDADDLGDYKVKAGAYDTTYTFENGYVKDCADPSKFTCDYVYADVDGKYITEVYSMVSWDANDTKAWTKNDALVYSQDLAINDSHQINIKTKDPYNFKLNSNDEDANNYFLEGAESIDAIPEGAIVTTYVGNERYILDKVDEDGNVVGEYKPGDVLEVADKKYTYSLDLLNSEGENLLDVYKSYLPKYVDAAKLSEAAKKNAYWSASTEDEVGTIVDPFTALFVGNYIDDGVFGATPEQGSASYMMAAFGTLVLNKYSLQVVKNEITSPAEYKGDGTPYISMVAASTKTVSGEITDYVAKEGLIYIDGEEYTAVSEAAMADDYTDNFGLAPKLNWMNYKTDEFLYANLIKFKGKEGTAYLNAEGQVAAWEFGKKELTYGIYEDGEYTNEGNFASGKKFSYKYKIHQANDEEAWIDLNEDMTKADIYNPGLFTYEIGLVVVPVDQLVKYTTNADGEITKANFGAAKLAAPAKIGVNGKLAGMIVSEDVVVFAKDGYDAKADYDVFGLEDLDGVVLGIGTEYFVEDNMIKAIKVNAPIAGKTSEINIVVSARAYSDHYAITFIDGTTVDTMDKKIGAAIANGEYVFAYVVYNTDGKIKTIVKANSTGANVVGTKLAAGQVADTLINFNGTVENAGITYIKDALNVTRPVTDATVYEWDGSALTASSLDQIKKGAAIRLVRTVSEGNAWDIVIYSTNSTKYYPTEF